jgi:hypothetical protein
MILYGALTVSLSIGRLTWIVCILGTIQVLFMQFIAGGLKDIDHDMKAGARTMAIKLGVIEQKGILKVTNGFKTLAYSIQAADVCMIFLPFAIIFAPLDFPNYLQIFILGFLCAFMIWISNNLLSLTRFDRNKMRTLIGGHYSINYALVPIMLMASNPWAGVLIIVPPAGFLLSNLVLHGTLLQPKTM